MSKLKRNVLRSRWLQLAEQMKAEDLGALLLTDPADVRWLTGFSGSNGAALAITSGAPLLATDGRYAEQAAAECPDAEIIITRELIEQLLLRLRENSATALGVDPLSLTLHQFRAISAHPAMFGVRVQEVESPLRDLRMVKELYELNRMRKAAKISTDALRKLQGIIEVGMSELHVARTMEAIMGDLGSEDRSFPTIVAAGDNGGRPHHQPTTRAIEAGDLLTIDFGAMSEGYRADCTRTFIVAAEPEDWQADAYFAVKRAAASARDAAKAGAETSAVDAAARKVIGKADLGEFFVHGLGHGIGLNLHEAPLLGASTAGTLLESVPFTVEPGVYIPGKGGVRIEDTCVIQPDGLEILTDFPRKLLCVG
ncbi:MAG: hypothetical protein RLZ55_1501 [Actinomycetota bacterium]|jgi:Xaa-Pro aminopeptidase